MMTTDRERHVHARLFSYAGYKKEIDEFFETALRQTAKQDDQSGVRGSFRSDPTARGGVMLADPPPRIREAMAWTRAIDDAWSECEMLDGGNPYGLAYLLERNFCLTGGPRPRSQNANARRRICEECGIAERTFYLWLDKVTSIAIYHASHAGLL